MENNGKGIFYGVIGVATLIVAIIGATFAYFSATASNEGTIRGGAATAELALTVTKLTEVTTVQPEGEGEATTQTAYGVMVPQKDAYINDAVTGSTNGQCIDDNGNVVCQLYKVTVTNSGSATAVLNGTISLAAEEGSLMHNLKWSVKAEETDTFDVYNQAISYEEQNGTANNVTGITALDTNLSLDAEEHKDYYVVVWISEIGSAQEDYDNGTFTGVVTFNSADGGLTSTFTGTTVVDPDAGA